MPVVAQHRGLTAVVLSPERHDEAGEAEAGDGGQEGCEDREVELPDHQVGHQAGTDGQEGVEGGEEGHGAGHQGHLQSPGVVLTDVPGGGMGYQTIVLSAEAEAAADSPGLEY